jgi:DNA modification methylase
MRVEHIGEATLYTADVLEALRAMADESVNCIVTSPPYWGLRDYGVPGQLGLEPTPEAYVARMVEVFREARRVLRRDGTCWVNLGDSYTTRMFSHDSLRNVAVTNGEWCKEGQRGVFNPIQPPQSFDGLKPKDLCGIPWRVAFALQADGWYLRSDIIWAKPNPMPESVTDRPTKAHEYLFLLSREPRYFYDAEAIKEESVTDDPRRPYGSPGANALDPRNHQGEGKLRAPANVERGGFNGKTNAMPGREAFRAFTATRNRRTVWTIATQPFPEAHFATFPEKLVEPCVLAGCPAQTCPECGAPWERVVERGELGGPGHDNYKLPKAQESKDDARVKGRSEGWWPNHRYDQRTTGFRPTCACAREDTIPGTLLDPFCGSGTALLVALRLGRRAVGIELKPEYMDMTRARISVEAAQVKLEL